MDIRQYISLINRQRTGKLDVQETQALQQWSQSMEGRAWLQDIQQIERLSDQYKSSYEPDVEAGLLKLKARIAVVKEETPTLRVASSRPWLRLAVAAAILIVGIVALRSWMQSNSSVETLAVQTQAEEQKQLALTDGTKVRLNNKTKLTLPKTFKNAKTRAVSLQGEAYFEVAPNPEKPFKIDADELTIVVIGTAFNVRAYPEEATTEVEVTHGTVRLALGKQELTLNANEKGVYDRQLNTLYKKSAPQLHAQAWRTHRLQFQDAPLSEVVEAIGRYHKIAFDLDSKIKNCKFTSDFTNTNLDKIMETLRVGMNVEITKISAKTYQISGKPCH